MDSPGSSFITALVLVCGLDSEVWLVIWTSLATSICAMLLAGPVGVVVGTMLGLGSFVGKRLVVTMLNTLMAMPTVVIGLLIYGVLSRQGVLGEMNLLFTPWAIIVGQFVLAVPIVAHHTLSAVTTADPRILLTARTLGAQPVQAVPRLWRELRFALIAAVIAGFGRVIGEVGIAMLLGGNIRGFTRTMTTAIALETSRGEYAFGLALGLVLISVALLVNILLHTLQNR